MIGQPHNRTVLITGASGFVGVHTARHFSRMGWRVVGYDAVQPPQLIPGTVFVRGNILDFDLLNRVVTDNDVSGIVHVAAIVREKPCLADPAQAVRVNVEGTANVLETARMHGAGVTYLSTATLYGRDPKLHPLTEATPPSPIGIYDTTKLMAEMLCQTYRTRFNVDVVAVRTGFVFGPGQEAAGYFLPQVARGEIVTEPDGADHPVDYTYVKDLAHGLYLCHTKQPLPLGVYNVTGGVLRARRQLLESVRQFYPSAQAEIGAGTSERINLRGPCVITAAQRDFGYRPRFSVESAVADWVESTNPRSVPIL